MLNSVTTHIIAKRCTMKFVKMQGAGNDFIILNNLDGSIKLEELPKLAACLCPRRISVGADGMIVVLPADGDADFRMLFYNADGSLGEMCGNGARCICRYAYENSLSGAEQVFETTAGIVRGRRIDKVNYQVKLNAPTYVELSHPVEVLGKKKTVSYIELGTPGLPHCVAVVDALDIQNPEEFRGIGKMLRYYKDFPKGANVTFVQILDKENLKAVTYERGVEDFTLACGTGCGATATALTLLGKVSPEGVRISMPGGELSIKLGMNNGKVEDIYLTGPTQIIYYGDTVEV